jgi:hypothetical protein
VPWACGGSQLAFASHSRPGRAWRWDAHSARPGTRVAAPGVDTLHHVISDGEVDALVRGELRPAAVAFCPHPPVLIPAIARKAAAEFAPLLAACDDAVQWLTERAAVVGIVGSRVPTAPVSHFAPGVAAHDLPPDDLPLSVAIGWWLIDRVAPAHDRFAVAVDPDGGRAALLRSEVQATEGPVGLLVMGDGSARRGPKAPGYVDPRAEPFDAAVSAGLAAADRTTLANLDVAAATELLVAGVGPWRAVARWTAEGEWTASVRYADASAGVQYIVATWARSDPAGAAAVSHGIAATVGKFPGPAVHAVAGPASS